MGTITSSDPLLPHTRSNSYKSFKGSVALLMSVFALILFITPLPHSLLTCIFPSSFKSNDGVNSKVSQSRHSSCEQARPIMPPIEIHNVSSVWEYKDKIVNWHQGIIRIPTEVYDQMGEPGEDDRWNIFQELHDCKSMKTWPYEIL